jgi:hypothetical protein
VRFGEDCGEFYIVLVRRSDIVLQLSLEPSVVFVKLGYYAGELKIHSIECRPTCLSISRSRSDSASSTGIVLARTAVWGCRFSFQTSFPDIPLS